MRRRKEEIGNRYGKIIVIAFAGVRSNGGSIWRVICDCGKEKNVLHHNLRAHRHISCKKCLPLTLKRLGHKTTTNEKTNPAFRHLYRIWAQMKTRCYNKNHKDYKHYGARGIRVYESWRISFNAFAEYIGDRPTPKHTLDRYPNNDGNYEPGNIRWATMKEQAKNKRNTTRLTILTNNY